MKHRARVVGGLLVAAALVGIGVYPVRKGLTVRYSPAQAKRNKRRHKKHHPARKLLFWW